MPIPTEPVWKARQTLASLAAATQRLQDSLAWSEAQRRNTKASYAAYLGAHPNGDHAKEARARMGTLETAEAKAADAVTIKAPGRATPPPPLRERAPGAPTRQLWPSADEPFIGADGRIRQH